MERLSPESVRATCRRVTERLHRREPLLCGVQEPRMRAAAPCATPLRPNCSRTAANVHPGAHLRSAGGARARAERFNSLIQAIKRDACGFRNRQRFRDAILFHLGGLDLYPSGISR